MPVLDEMRWSVQGKNITDPLWFKEKVTRKR